MNTIKIQQGSRVTISKSGKSLGIWNGSSQTVIPYQIPQGLGWGKAWGQIFVAEQDMEGELPELLEQIQQSDSYKTEHAAYCKDRQEREAAKEATKLISDNYNKNNIEEIYQAVKYHAKNNNEWFACDILLEDNALSKLLLQKIGSYSATAYDNGQILIKGAKGKVSLLRANVNVAEGRSYNQTLYSLIQEQQPLKPH